VKPPVTAPKEYLADPSGRTLDEYRGCDDVLRVEDRTQDDAVIVTPVGRLGAESYQALRDHLLKVGTDAPRAVIVDISELGIESEPSLAVFLAVQTRLQQWPGVPLLLVTGSPTAREIVARNRTANFLPVHSSVADAIAAIDEPPPRQVARQRLPNALSSPRAAREFTRMTCHQWGCPEVLDEVTVLVNELVTNAVVHTLSSPDIRLERRRNQLFTVAVYDDLPGAVSVRDPGGGGGFHGLLLVAQVAAAWGCSPTSSGGKVVWATVRPR